MKKLLNTCLGTCLKMAAAAPFVIGIIMVAIAPTSAFGSCSEPTKQQFSCNYIDPESQQELTITMTTECKKAKFKQSKPGEKRAHYVSISVPSDVADDYRRFEAFPYTISRTKTSVTRSPITLDDKNLHLSDYMFTFVGNTNFDERGGLRVFGSSFVYRKPMRHELNSFVLINFASGTGLMTVTQKMGGGRWRYMTKTYNKSHTVTASLYQCTRGE